MLTMVIDFRWDKHSIYYLKTMIKKKGQKNYFLFEKSICIGYNIIVLGRYKMDPKVQGEYS